MYGGHRYAGMFKEERWPWHSRKKGGHGMLGCSRKKGGHGVLGCSRKKGGHGVPGVLRKH